MSTYSDLLTLALQELSVVSGGEQPNGDDIQAAKNRCQQLADLWNARGLMAFNRTFKNYTLTPNHQPHLIGPGLNAPDFDTGAGVGGGTVANQNRPGKIYGAAIIFNNVSPNITKPIPVRDDDWWAKQRVKSLSSSVPTDLYYSPDFPNGSLFLWPVPNFAYGLELELRQSLSQMDLGDPITLPPGYELALTLSLAEEMISLFPANGRDDRMLIARAARARGIIAGGNSAAPKMSTRDGGLGSGSGGDGFNYYSGEVV